MPSDARLPQTPEEVTADWLSDALAERHPGVRARAVDVLEIHHGTNSNARLGVTWEGDPGLPDTFFLKMLPLDPERRKTIDDTGMGKREALFYRHLADDVPMRVPRPYVALLDEDNQNAPTLILAADTAAHQEVETVQGKRILTDPKAICRQLAQTYGGSRPK